MLNSTLVTGGTRLRIRKYPKSCYWGALARTLWVVTRRCMMRDLRLAPLSSTRQAGSHRRADGRQTRPRRAASCADHGDPVPWAPGECVRTVDSERGRGGRHRRRSRQPPRGHHRWRRPGQSIVQRRRRAQPTLIRKPCDRPPMPSRSHPVIAAAGT